MPEITYVLCAATSVLCAVLLLRGYLRSRSRLLMWSTLCFFGLAINNILLYVDPVILPDSIDLRIVRSGSALVSLILMVAGLIWEAS
jgi:cytochrome bd-type quinol oxidase subunit 2